MISMCIQSAAVRWFLAISWILFGSLVVVAQAPQFAPSQDAVFESPLRSAPDLQIRVSVDQALPTVGWLIDSLNLLGEATFSADPELLDVVYTGSISMRGGHIWRLLEAAEQSKFIRDAKWIKTQEGYHLTGTSINPPYPSRQWMD